MIVFGDGDVREVVEGGGGGAVGGVVGGKIVVGDYEEVGAN